jgi:hypothetical protein
MTVNTVARPRGHPGYSETMPCAAASAETPWGKRVWGVLRTEESV